MTYARPLKPMFYTDSINWLKINGRAKATTLTDRAGTYNSGYDKFDLFDLQPQNEVSFDTSGNVTTHILIQIDFGVAVSCDSFSLLNHNLVSAEGRIRIAHSSGTMSAPGDGTVVSNVAVVLNGTEATEIVTPASDGDTVFTFDSASDRYWLLEIEDITNFSATDLTMGACLLGEHYTMPHNQDQSSLNHGFQMLGVSVAESEGGKRFANSRWTKANSASTTATNYIPFRSGTGVNQIPGRESYSANFSFIADTDLLPSDLSSPVGDTFIHKVVSKLGLQTLPCVFTMDSTSTTQGDYIFGRLTGNSFNLTQQAHNLYSTGFTIEQEF